MSSALHPDIGHLIVSLLIKGKSTGEDGLCWRPGPGLLKHIVAAEGLSAQEAAGWFPVGRGERRPLLALLAASMLAGTPLPSVCARGPVCLCEPRPSGPALVQGDRILTYSQIRSHS